MCALATHRKAGDLALGVTARMADLSNLRGAEPLHPG
jgi:hypothetical protein